MRKSKPVTGYKVFNHDWTCNGFQFAVGQEYTHPRQPMICFEGFHFCTELRDCFRYYPLVQWTRIATVEATGKIVGHDTDSKRSTNKIKIVQEISFDDAVTIIGKQCDSRGVNDSWGVNGSWGVSGSRGVSGSLFVSAIRDPLLFNKPVTAERIAQVCTNLGRLLGFWEPAFNNLKSLWIQCGQQWECTPIPKAAAIQKKEAWADMPRAAIDYLRSLPEFDARVFEEVTGIITEAP